MWNMSSHSCELCSGGLNKKGKQEAWDTWEEQKLSSHSLIRFKRYHFTVHGSNKLASIKDGPTKADVFLPLMAHYVRANNLRWWECGNTDREQQLLRIKQSWRQGWPLIIQIRGKTKDGKAELWLWRLACPNIHQHAATFHQKNRAQLRATNHLRATNLKFVKNRWESRQTVSDLRLFPDIELLMLLGN